MRLRLRWKLLAFTAVAPVLLALGTLWTVNRNVSGHLEDNIHDSLRRSARVFEDKPGFKEVFMPGGRAPREGEIFRNPALAKTLHLLAEKGRDA